jgi:hypothetical protein
MAIIRAASTPGAAFESRTLTVAERNYPARVLD